MSRSICKDLGAHIDSSTVRAKKRKISDPLDPLGSVCSHWIGSESVGDGAAYESTSQVEVGDIIRFN